MATYTTNYNLEKPEASDPFGDFRQSYNNNMDIIDQNLGGGGGSGGHTILDGDGNALPQEDDLQFTGACSVSDDNVNGATVVNVVACKKVTQAEYDALPASKLTDNIAYFIVDGESDEYKAKADKTDLASIQITGSTNDTGSTITSGTYFYLNDTLVRAKTGIANGATLTLNTNYEVVTAGALNTIKDVVFADDSQTYTVPTIGGSVDVTKTPTIPSGYSLIGVLNAITGTGRVLCNGYIYNNQPYLTIVNINSTVAGQTKTATWTNVFQKN